MQKKETGLRLLVIIPAFNEEDTIESVIEDLKGQEPYGSDQAKQLKTIETVT